MNAAAKPSSQIVSKITRADMGLQLPRLDMDQQPGLSPEELAKAREKVSELVAKYAYVYDIGGRVAKTRLVKGKADKEGVQMIGEFQARLAPHLGSTIFYSGRAHVPSMLEEMLYSQLVDSQKEDPEATIDFLFRVGIKPPKPGKASAVGYEWTVEPLVEMERASNPVQALFDRANQPRQLAAPVSSPADQLNPEGELDSGPARHKHSSGSKKR